MSEKAKQVKELVKSKLRNWTGLTDREILSCILALAEAIEELNKPLASPPITRPATAEGGAWRL